MPYLAFVCFCTILVFWFFRASKQTIEGVVILRTAIRRYQTCPACLTAIHSDLLQVGIRSVPRGKRMSCVCSVQVCLMAKCLKPALPFLEQEYSELLTDVSSTVVLTVGLRSTTSDVFFSIRVGSLTLATFCSSITMEGWCMPASTST